MPRTAAEWKERSARSAAEAGPHLPAIRERLRVGVEAARIAGVGVFVATPAEMPAANRDRLLVHLHGGGYVLYPGEAGAGGAMQMAGYGRVRVVSVDYRMPPDFPFPAALDDALAVWRALLADRDPRRMAVFGSSAGGGLTLAMVLRARAEGLPLPAAIAPGTPWADLTGTGTGDSVEANAYVDNVLVSNSGWLGAAAALYAAGRDLRDPFISPLHGDFRGLPPAILTSGTRDLFLSDAVRAHRKLRRAGVEAALQVFEGQSHAQFLDPFVPSRGGVRRDRALPRRAPLGVTGMGAPAVAIGTWTGWTLHRSASSPAVPHGASAPGSAAVRVRARGRSRPAAPADPPRGTRQARSSDDLPTPAGRELPGVCGCGIAAALRWGHFGRGAGRACLGAGRFRNRRRSTEKAMPLQRTSGIPLVSVAVALASGAPEKSRAEVYAGVCACNYDSEADSCHAEQTVSGDSIEELSRVCSNQLGEHARMVAGSVRGEPQQNLRDVGYPGDAPDSGS